MLAEDFIEALKIINQDFTGSVPKREIFSLAKKCQLMPVNEVVKLLHENHNDLKLGAVSILDWKARNKKTTIEEREACYHAYINNHKNIDDWGLVDRAAPYVIGGYLFDKSRKPLYQLAKSKLTMERRTAMVSTYFFIRQNDIADTFKIAEILVNDTEIVVQTAVGSWIREAGKKDEGKLISFLNKHAGTMPRIALRYAIEKLDRETKAYYLKLKDQI